MSSGAAQAGFLEASEVRRIFDEHRRGLSNHGRLLYALAMFSCWWKDQQRQPASPREPQLARKRALETTAEGELTHA
jgi:hypothetical protein